MPAVNVIISETLDGSQVSDPLQGSGTGVDMGQAGTGSWTPIIDKAANTGHLDLYVRHDGLMPIFGCATFIQPYGTGTAFTYGGNDSAVNDFATLKAMGLASGSSKNNADGNSEGIWVDMDWDATAGTRFDQANFPDLVKIYGDNNTDGISISSAFPVAAEAMVYDSGGTETGPSAPVDGKIGAQSAPTVFGDNAHLKLRAYLKSTFGQSGYIQVEYVFSYSYEG